MKNPLTGQLGRSRTLLCRSPFLAAACAVMATVAAYAQPPATPPAATPPAGTPAVAPGPVKIRNYQRRSRAGEDQSEGTAAIAEIDKKMGPKAQQIQKDCGADLNDLQKETGQLAATLRCPRPASRNCRTRFKSKPVRCKREIQDYQDEGQAEETLLSPANLSGQAEMWFSSQFATPRDGYTIIFNVSQDNTPVLCGPPITPTSHRRSSTPEDRGGAGTEACRGSARKTPGCSIDVRAEAAGSCYTSPAKPHGRPLRPRLHSIVPRYAALSGISFRSGGVRV